MMYETHEKLRLFILRGMACECCGQPGVHFVALQCYGKNGGIRLALYTENWVELTSDHVIAKSAGGGDGITNRQILCRACNSIKADLELTIPELRDKINRMFRGVVYSTTNKY